MIGVHSWPHKHGERGAVAVTQNGKTAELHAGQTLALSAGQITQFEFDAVFGELPSATLRRRA
jgi:hypothetical protein